MKKAIGQSTLRSEDFRLVTGQGRYIHDLDLPGQLHGYVVRSPHAHARIAAIDKDAAAAAAGVAGVFTATDLLADGVGKLRFPISIKNRDGTPIIAPARHALADDRVRHVGDNVAFVVAEVAAIRRAAAELLTVDYETLPAVLDPALATLSTAPRIWDEAPENPSYLGEGGDRAAVDELFAKANHICELTLEHNCLIAAPIETRGAIGVYEEWQDRYTLYACVQDPQGTHSVLSQHGLGIEGSKLRVIVPDVGGGFGMKNFAYPEHVLVLWAARKLGRPVKWVADRPEKPRERRSKAAATSAMPRSRSMQTESFSRFAPAFARTSERILRPPVHAFPPSLVAAA